MCRDWAHCDSISPMSSPMANGLRVAVTGAAGSIGSRLVASLAASDDVGAVVALDARPIDLVHTKVHSYQRDILQPIDDLLKDHGIASVVHLAFQLKPGRNREAARRINVGGTARVLQSCQFADVDHIVYLSSSTVYGAHPANDAPFTEDSPVWPVRGFQYAEDKASTELLLQAYASDYPDTKVTMLRGCVVMGPNSDNFITKAFSKPLLVRIRGTDPQMQFIHEDDLRDVLELCLKERFSGVYNVAGGGTVPYSHIAAVAGRRAFPVPAAILYPLTQFSWGLRLQSDSPACGLDMIRWPWVADIGKLQRKTGFSPKYTSQEALEASTLAKKPTNNS
jgi:UDP-glucose 4-epimerase